MADSKEHEKFKVLFVDDEEGVLRSLKRLFMDEAFEVLTASSGKEGLDVIKNNEVAVIISDQRMPEMSGAEFLEKSKTITPDSVRMVLTGYADINAAMDAINKGEAFRYIAKPWNDNELILTIREAVDKYRLAKENKYLTALTEKQNDELKKWSAELETYVQQQTIDLTKQNKELKKLNEKLNNNLKDIISAFSNLIELRDRSISSHSNNVADISGKVARKIGLKDSEIETIVIAAQLHDIGKIGISDAVMSKSPAVMSPDELAEYRKHSIRGQICIDFIEDLREAGVLIRHHHEWHDGKGFPDGLKGTKIPIGSRIIALADKFDRLIHGIFEVHPAQKVLGKMRGIIGQQFDPELFAAFIEVAEKEFAASPDSRSAFEFEQAAYIESALNIDQLSPGMLISRDIRSGTGILLLNRGAILDDRKIEILQRYSHIDPGKDSMTIWIMKKRG